MTCTRTRKWHQCCFLSIMASFYSINENEWIWTQAEQKNSANTRKGDQRRGGTAINLLTTTSLNGQLGTQKPYQFLSRISRPPGFHAGTNKGPSSAWWSPVRKRPPCSFWCLSALSQLLPSLQWQEMSLWNHQKPNLQQSMEVPLPPPWQYDPIMANSAPAWSFGESASVRQLIHEFFQIHLPITCKVKIQQKRNEKLQPVETNKQTKRQQGAFFNVQKQHERKSAWI